MTERPPVVRASHVIGSLCNYSSSYYRSVIKDQVLQSKQMGRRENKSMNCEGRVPFDLLLVRFILCHCRICFNL